MKSMLRMLGAWAAALLLAVLAAGCKKPNTEKPQENGPSRDDVQNAILKNIPAAHRAVTALELKQIWVYYDELCEGGVGPAKLDDMKSLRLQAPKYYKLIEDGDVVVRWKANTRALGGEPGRTVLAYDKDVPTEHGPVLMLNGDVVPNMFPDEFKTLKMAGVK
jgi:hypothetical protein